MKNGAAEQRPDCGLNGVGMRSGPQALTSHMVGLCRLFASAHHLGLHLVISAEAAACACRVAARRQHPQVPSVIPPSETEDDAVFLSWTFTPRPRWFDGLGVAPSRTNSQRARLGRVGAVVWRCRTGAHDTGANNRQAARPAPEPGPQGYRHRLCRPVSRSPPTSCDNFLSIRGRPTVAVVLLPPVRVALHFLQLSALCSEFSVVSRFLGVYGVPGC